MNFLFAWGVGNLAIEKIAPGGWSGLELTDTLLYGLGKWALFVHAPDNTGVYDIPLQNQQYSVVALTASFQST